MDELQTLKGEIEAIKERNHRVEIDKAWERSPIRIMSVVVITYIIAVLVMYAIGITNYLLSALIPTIGYFLSTQSLPFIKRRWIKYFYKK